MDKIAIFKRLKQHYNKVKDEGYNPLFICLQGSQNYGLDDSSSDIDSIVAIIPTEEDIISGNRVSTTIIMDNNEHIDVKDIRDIISLWVKGNTQFIQILFTEFKIINKNYRDYVNYYFDNAEKITQVNRINLFKNIQGMSNQCFKNYNNINLEYMYDGKRVYHLLRLNQLASNLIKGMSYKEAMQTFDPEVYIMIMKCKNYAYDCIKVQQLCNMYYENTKSIIDRYLFNQALEDKTKLVLNQEILEELKYRTKLLMRNIYLDQVLAKRDNIYPDNFKNVYVISDTHFGHTNILKYENRLELMGLNSFDRY